MKLSVLLKQMLVETFEWSNVVRESEFRSFICSMFPVATCIDFNTNSFITLTFNVVNLFCDRIAIY